jgi:malonate-semialdehyde dehydrogenase (acetylating)/methylmalonate-semialdehyde dehydrogenase
MADVAKGNETVEWATSLPQLAAGRTLMVSGGITCQENRVPLGVVGAIVPFNFPAMVPMWTVPISLTMGNCVILKPSEKVPTTMMRMAELLTEAGLPAGVFQIVHGAVDVVTALCDHPQVSAVTFVGSSKVANIVATKCRNLNKRVLALGGAKNHLIALPDCDVGMTCKDVVASFAGCCGQRCMAASVLLVMRDGGNEDQLINEIVAASGALKPGQVAGQVGPLIDNIAKERLVSTVLTRALCTVRLMLKCVRVCVLGYTEFCRISVPPRLVVRRFSWTVARGPSRSRRDSGWDLPSSCTTTATTRPSRTRSSAPS